MMLVGVLFGVLLMGGTNAGVSPLLSVVQQGYDNMVVGLSPLLDESEADKVIQGIKVAIRDTSENLFKATGNRLFFRKVKILLPSTWTSVKVDEPATNEVFEESHMRVDVKNPVYGDQVYTVQPGVCGEPGLYIHITPTYLTHPDVEDVWGPRGKVLTQAWARYRWGIFDEIGYPEDQRYPLFYHTRNSAQELVVKPNYCGNHDVKGKLVDITGGSCKYVGDIPDKNCRFEPDNEQSATSSMMSFLKPNSIKEFCDDENEQHNPEAPNRHNELCAGQSIWDIIKSHPDFNNTRRLPENHPTNPEVLVVQQKGATFALVLDYSGSMNNKINVLANTAKRWLLHDVADGSFVSIIKFSSSAIILKGLTEVSNATRKSLAAAISTSTGGSTCIGCGLKKALDVMKSQNNKVILLITDGEENVSPKIADVMNDVVESGARVVTISYGVDAEETLESLAQNTGGKSYIVPDNDDGSFMNDAFQGALTYQPGQSITNTKIKIYDWEGMTTPANTTSGAFTVDATVGRNLEFRLNVLRTSSGSPMLISPSGRVFIDFNFEPNMKLWMIVLDEAEAGTWMWNMSSTGFSMKIIVTVTAQARDPQTLPIITTAWMNTGTDFVDASQQHVIVYGRVSQGEKPVVGAKVRAYITTPSTTTPAVELDLLDNGQNADMQAGDGIYSRYFTQFVGIGRYAVKAQVWDEGGAFINNGFITSRRRRSLDDLDAPEYCCGSIVPFNAQTAVPTGTFTRNAAAGSFNVVTMPLAGDTFPPSQVKDLRVYSNDTTSFILCWTAPGDDLDIGTVTGYEIWISKNSTLLSNDLDEQDLSATISLLDLNTSMGIPELLKETGEEVCFQPILETTLISDTLYFLAIRAVDDAGNWSPLSRPLSYANVTVTPSAALGTSSFLNTWTTTLLTLVLLRVAF